MEPERVETPFTVTLTDMDFTAMTWEVGSLRDGTEGAVMNAQ